MPSIRQSNKPISLQLPIDFSSLHSSQKQSSKNKQDNPSKIQAAKRQKPTNTDRAQNADAKVGICAFNDATLENPSMHDVAPMIPRFDNPSNNCWLNSVLQVLLQVMMDKGDAPNCSEAHIRQDLVPYGYTLHAELEKYMQPGQFSVNALCSPPRNNITLKQLILFAMGISSITELHRQHDAAHCLQAILGISPHLSFLWHVTDESLICEGCGRRSTTSIPYSIASVDFSSVINRNSFDAVRAIKNYFESTENGVERRCSACHSTTCSKSLTLPEPAKFIIVQLKRFSRQTQGNTTTTHKLNAEAKPFTALEIYSSQGYCNYEVIATVEHLGSQLSQGHYVAYVKRNGNWMLCNDDRITSLGRISNTPIRNAYLLILKHMDEEEEN